MIEFAQTISGKLKLKTNQTQVVLKLLAEGATIPFIARYRKDTTGNLDEVQIAAIQEEAKFQKEFSERKAFIEKTIDEQGKLTDDLKEKLNNANTITELEDIYLPYKPKRKTKAQTAKENGLQPLADLLLKQTDITLNTEAEKYVTENVKSVEEALQGARDIIAETINEDATIRAKMRKYFEDEAKLVVKLITGKETEAIKYKDYFDYSELVMKVPSHRALAVLRGFVEGFLRMNIEPEENLAIEYIEEDLVIGMNDSTVQVKKAVKDAYRRLLQPSLESEFRMALKQRSDEEAINVFAENLKQLLLAAPLGSKKILAIDPGYRTGCKVICLDANGAFLHSDLIFPHESNKVFSDGEKIKHLVNKYQIEAFAIGDGTAGRETEQFIKQLNLSLPVFMVNEDGASVYSASEIAREEFPNEDITVRGSISIGRRLMDPLAELVKIDPKSIGVGQYQHDVNQFRLKEKLDQTVISCVNAVGVNINTSSKHLLSYVSGIGETIAKNIVAYRNEIGTFKNRTQLLQVTRLGDKAYEQCAGFLRIQNGENPLDASGVHPETYPLVFKMATDLKVETAELIGNEKMLNAIDVTKYASFGSHTVTDVIKELKKPGLDPRSTVQTFEFANIFKIEDVHEGMVVPGIVTNITRFGAFVDIGVKQDGLVHVSEIAHKYISDPSEVLKLNQQVMVKVTQVDVERKRIALSIKQATDNSNAVAKKVQNNKTGNINPASKDATTIEDALASLKKKFGKN